MYGLNNNVAQRDFVAAFIEADFTEAVRKHGNRRMCVWYKRVLARSEAATRVETAGHRAGNVRAHFGTTYHVSRIQDGYGSYNGLEEIAVMFDGCCYTTVVTQDVIGYLTYGQANRVEQLVAALSPDGTFSK